jgi:hypothetical protein
LSYALCSRCEQPCRAPALLAAGCWLLSFAPRHRPHSRHPLAAHSPPTRRPLTSRPTSTFARRSAQRHTSPLTGLPRLLAYPPSHPNHTPGSGNHKQSSEPPGARRARSALHVYLSLALALANYTPLHCFGLLCSLLVYPSTHCSLRRLRCCPVTHSPCRPSPSARPCRKAAQPIPYWPVRGPCFCSFVCYVSHPIRRFKMRVAICDILSCQLTLISRFWHLL